MTELKTLEAIDEEYDTPDTAVIAAIRCHSADLRQNVITWVKELRKEDNGLMPNITSFEKREKFAIISFIKHFFNITEYEINKEEEILPV